MRVVPFALLQYTSSHNCILTLLVTELLKSTFHTNLWNSFLQNGTAKIDEVAGEKEVRYVVSNTFLKARLGFIALITLLTISDSSWPTSWSSLIWWIKLVLWFSLQAVTQRCSIKKVFLKISQYSQENTCAKASFLIKLQASGMKQETLEQVFSCEFCEISKNTFLHRTPLVAASVSSPKTGYKFPLPMLGWSFSPTVVVVVSSCFCAILLRLIAVSSNCIIIAII